jgi:hypothetical protein
MGPRPYLFVWNRTVLHAFCAQAAFAMGGEGGVLPASLADRSPGANIAEIHG